jgi:hypothetical protein
MNTNRVKSGFYTEHAKGYVRDLPATGYNSTYLKTLNHNELPKPDVGPYTYSSTVFGPVSTLKVAQMPISGYNHTYLKTSNTLAPIVGQPRTVQSARKELEESLGTSEAPTQQQFVDKVELLKRIVARATGSDQAQWKELLRRVQTGAVTEEELDDRLAMLDNDTLQQLVRAQRMAPSPVPAAVEKPVADAEVEQDELNDLLSKLDENLAALTTPRPSRRKPAKKPKRTFVVQGRDGTQTEFKNWVDARLAAGLPTNTTSKDLPSNEWVEGSEGFLRARSGSRATPFRTTSSSANKPQTSPPFQRLTVPRGTPLVAQSNPSPANPLFGTVSGLRRRLGSFIDVLDFKTHATTFLRQFPGD